MEAKYQINECVDIVCGENRLVGGRIFQVCFRENAVCYCIEFNNDKKARMYFIDESHLVSSTKVDIGDRIPDDPLFNQSRVLASILIPTMTLIPAWDYIPTNTYIKLTFGIIVALVILLGMYIVANPITGINYKRGKQ